jgi:putative oxidoreductase
MKAKIPMIIRILFGLIMFASGLAGLLGLAKPPPDLPEHLVTFMNGLMATGYFMTLLKLTETICGLMLLSGFYVPLALVVLAPIILNIFLTHAFMQPSGLPLAVILGTFLIYLSFFVEPYRTTILPLFRKK